MLLTFSKRCCLGFLAAWIFLLGSHAYSQETGPLFMKVEMGFTLGGGVAGAALGGVVWLTDPGNPASPLFENVKNGIILGTILGSIFGYYVLYNAALVPDEQFYFPEGQGFDLGMNTSAKKQPGYQDTSPQIAMNVFRYHF